MKYVILADSNNVEPFKTPRHLSIINGETVVGRTIRLLKENGIDDILITSHDKRFDNLGAIRYEPQNNDYKPTLDYFSVVHTKGYWLNAFPFELLNEPITFLFGDVYYSENAIKTIVGSQTNSILFFCTYKNEDSKYIKHHDEPLGFKVINYELFKEHINKVKKMKDEGKTKREPIAWELYRSINGLDINTHILTTNYIAINDETCDIDRLDDIMLLRKKLGGNSMVKCKVLEKFHYKDFDKLQNLKRASINIKGTLMMNDEFECDAETAEYLTGNNPLKRAVVKILEVIPEEKVEVVEEPPKEEIKPVQEHKPKKTTKKKNSKK